MSRASANPSAPSPGTLDLATELAALRPRIQLQFGSLPLPRRESLTRGNTAAARYAEEARSIEARLAGRHWTDIGPAEAKKCWPSFCYLAPDAYRFYLPALLVAALASVGRDDALVHAVLYHLQPSYGCLYWEGSDESFARRSAVLSPGQYAVVVDFLGLFFRHTPMAPLAAMALRHGWNAQPGMPAYRAAMASYEHDTNWTCPPAPEPVRALVAQIEEAFADTHPPPLETLCASRQGDEPAEVCIEMAGLDWRRISPGHLDRNQTCLSFMTPAGVCYYLPAYLRADVMGLLQTDGALFHLQYDPSRFESLSAAQRAAVAGFLRFVGDRDLDGCPEQAEGIERALAAYWEAGA